MFINWKDRKSRWFTLFAVIIFILNITMNMINGRFWLSDFKVYYFAASNMISGLEVYHLSFGDVSGLYKYSPISLFFFFPFTLFSYTVASILHFSLLCFAFWYAFLLIRNLLEEYFFPDYKGNTEWILILSMMFILLYLVKELYLGNINILLLLLCLMVLQTILKGKPVQAGIIFGLVVLTKPFFLILIIPLLLRKNVKMLVVFVITLVSGLVIPFMVFGLPRGLALTENWLGTMLQHGQSYPGVNDLVYILKYYISRDLPFFTGYLIIISAGMLITWFVCRNLSMESGDEQAENLAGKNFIFEWFLILGVLPDLVSTDSEHFLASAPLITFILFFVARFKYYRLIPLLVIIFFFFGGNSDDLLGHRLSNQLYIMGLLGISNLVLVSLSVILFLDFRKRVQEEGKLKLNS